MKKGQVSTEYLMVVGFSLLILVPVLAAFFLQTQDLQDSVDLNAAKEAVRTIAENADLVYTMGPPTTVVIKVRVPDKVTKVSFQGRQVTMEVETAAGLSDVFETASANMTGNMSAESGTHKLKLTAQSSSVQITEISS